MIEWDTSYSVGVAIIDKEHKKFFDIINKAVVARKHNGNLKAISRILYQILYDITEYTNRHFKTEETYMIKFRYPEYQSHREEHRVFSIAMLNYKIKLINGNCKILDDIVDYLLQWLVKHIQETDKKYADCFSKNGLM